MKMTKLIPLICLLSLSIAEAAFAGPKKSVSSKNIDSLGGNSALMEMADTLNPELKSRVVQNRTVDRNLRLEVGLNYGGVAGGTTYLETQNVGVNLDFHMTPRWSLGLRYYDFNSKLSPEGNRLFEEARANNGLSASGGYVDIDTPLNSTMAVINWFPIYGKLSAFESSIVQFDLYLLLGGGQIQLESGPSSIVTAGGGLGFWLTKHVTARAELRYQGYRDLIKSGPRDINAVVGTLGLGWIL